MVALALNPLAAEFTPCGAPPGLMGSVSLQVGPPGVHTVVDEVEVVDDVDDEIIAPPPGLTLAAPPGLACPPGLELVEEESRCLAAPPGKFAPPGNFTPKSPPGKLAAPAPPGFFVAAGPPGVLSTQASPPGVWAKDSDALSASESTDAESDTESSVDGSFSE